MNLRDRIYYKILPCFLALAEWFEIKSYNRQKRQLTPGHSTGDAHLFLTHGRGGGVDKFVEDTAASIEQAWILHYNPLKRRFILSYKKIHTDNAVSYKFPSQYAEMIKHLQSLGLKQLHIHHTRYLPFYFFKDLPEFAQTLGVPYDYTMHDFIAFCPRIHLIDENFSYCGMPQDASLCTTCIKKNGSLTRAPKNAAEWRDINHTLLNKATELLAPSHDTAERHKKILGDMQIKVMPHDTPNTILHALPARPAGTPYVIGIIGRIHLHKGADIIAACAEDARKRNLPLTFSIIGDSKYGPKLRESGVAITGAYKEEELPKLLEQSGASLIFLPSIWPETYSYVLSHIWENGYFPVAFDLGAPAERIKEANCGLALPIYMMHSPGVINDALLEAAKKQH